jgi:transposase
MDIIDLCRDHYERQGRNKTQIASILNISRNTVHKYLEGAEAGYHRTKAISRTKYDTIYPIVDQWLNEDKIAPRKQRRSRRKIFNDLKAQYNYSGSYETVKLVVRAIQGINKEVYIPREHKPGQCLEFDFGEAKVRVNGVEHRIYMHCFQLPYSNDIFMYTSLRCTQEEMFESHRRAFIHFEGIPDTIRYDNLAQAVKKVLKGRRREESENFKKFRSQFGFNSYFCAVARGQEKGDVEGCVRYARSNYLSPVPELQSLHELESLNSDIAQWCKSLRTTRITFNTQLTVGHFYNEEKEKLQLLPRKIPEVGKSTTAKANHYSLICVDQVYYSVPTQYAHHRVDVLMCAREIIIYYKENEIARHTRSWERGKQVFDPLHYLALFKEKPGALWTSKPIAQLPHAFTVFFTRAGARGYDTARDCVKILELLRTYKDTEIAEALELAMAYDTYYPEGVKNILNQLQTAQPMFNTLATLSSPSLEAIKVKKRDLSQYNRLIPKEVIV